MSSLRNAMKSSQKQHRERGQLSGRKHLGNLEKKKDYVLRAKNYHKKQSTIKTLKKKALEKNPDEFYFQMISSRTKDGVHKNIEKGKTYTKDQIRLMKTQDLNYLNMKERSESKKIQKLKSELHFTEVADQQKRNHMFFVDSKKEVENFDAAKRMNTLPELLHRSHNIPTLSTLQKIDFEEADSQQQENDKERDKAYTKLKARINRKTQLQEARDSLVLQRKLMQNGGGVKKKKNNNGKATYKWKKARKS